METKTKIKTLLVESTAFGHNGHIPSKYTCEGDDINPPITVEDIPDETKTLALIMEDPDAPSGVFDHWLLWNLLPSEAIDERTSLGTSGMNSFGKTGYGGPCPPSGTHRYSFKVYALDRELSIAAGENKKALLEGMQGHIIAVGQLTGRYKRRKTKNSL